MHESQHQVGDQVGPRQEGQYRQHPQDRCDDAGIDVTAPAQDEHSNRHFESDHQDHEQVAVWHEHIPHEVLEEREPGALGVAVQLVAPGERIDRVEDGSRQIGDADEGSPDVPADTPEGPGRFCRHDASSLLAAAGG